MLFMNTWEIDERADRHASHAVLGPATRTLANLRDAADRNSDGWCYWPKPARAAKKLMELIQRCGDTRAWPPQVATTKELRAAYAPLKSFRTKSGLDFEIVEPVKRTESCRACKDGFPINYETCPTCGRTRR